MSSGGRKATSLICPERKLRKNNKSFFEKRPAIAYSHMLWVSCILLVAAFPLCFFSLAGATGPRALEGLALWEACKWRSSPGFVNFKKQNRWIIMCKPGRVEESCQEPVGKKAGKIFYSFIFPRKEGRSHPLLIRNLWDAHNQFTPINFINKYDFSIFCELQWKTICDLKPSTTMGVSKIVVKIKSSGNNHSENRRRQAFIRSINITIRIENRILNFYNFVF